MMTGLGETTNLDVQQITNKSDFYSSRAGSNFSQTQSLSQIDVKDDARDLLERYSKALLEQFETKLRQSTKK